MATQVFRDEQSVARFHAHWNQRIDELADGALGDDDFIAEVMGLDRDARESPWAVIAIMDRRVRRGMLSGELFHGIESRIAQREFARPDAERTVDLPAPPPRFTPRFRPVVSEPPPETAPASAAPPVDEPPQLPPGEVPVVNELAAGTVLAERYVIRGCVGDAGMGRVYQALDRVRREQGGLDWHVAVKVLRTSQPDPEQALARLQREFDTASRLAHRNIIRVFEIEQDGPLDFLTMEFLLGELLSKFLSRFHGEPLPRDEAWSIIRDIGAALAYAHSLGVVHADLQPQNIMMLKNGDIKLMAFGAVDPGASDARAPGYASPELLAGLPPDPRDDLFALACIGYELLAGTHPFDHQRASEARERGLTPAEPRGLRPAQWQLLRQALAFERDARPATVRGWLEGLGLQAAPAVVAPREPFVFERPEALLAIQLAEPDAPPDEPAADLPAAASAEPIVVPAVAEQTAPAARPAETVDLPVPVHGAWSAPAAPVEITEEIEIPLASVAMSAEPFVTGLDEAPVRAAAVPVVEPTVWTPPPVKARPRTAPPGPRRAGARWLALGGGGLVAIAAVWALLFWHRPVPDEVLALEPLVVPEVAPLTPVDTAAEPPPAKPVVARAATPKPAVVKKPAVVAATTRAPATPPKVAPRLAAVRKPARAVPAAGGTVAITPAAYSVSAGARFAEVKVTRSDASKPLNFTWWTEEGTALSGVDFIAQPKSTAYLAAGTRSTTLFVKMTANSARKQSVRFSVLISRPSIGALGAARAVVTLPPKR